MEISKLKFGLLHVIEGNNGKRVGVGELRVDLMARDCFNAIQELETENAKLRATPENKPLTCDGCIHHNPDAPWPEICFDCKRRSRQDMYRRKPEGSENNA